MEPNNTNQINSAKQQLFTVTPFSKILALILFIALPFIAFWLGRQYSEPVNPAPVSLTATTSDEVTEEPEPESETVQNELSAPAPTYTPPTNTTPPVSTGPTVMTVFITAMTLDSMSVDNIAIYEEEAAVQRMIADGLCPATEPEKCRPVGGVYYRNTDPTIRTYPISQDVEVLTWTGTEYPLSKLANNPQTKTPYTITINGGLVTQIKEVYRP